MLDSKPWQFSTLSCSLMSLLASRTHEWTAWTISEGGCGHVEPSRVGWLDLTIEFGGTAKSLRCDDLATAQALELFESITTQPKAKALTGVDGWSLIWESDGFLSEFVLPQRLATEHQEWKLVRGSAIRPSLWINPHPIHG